MVFRDELSDCLAESATLRGARLHETLRPFTELHGRLSLFAADAAGRAAWASSDALYDLIAALHVLRAHTPFSPEDRMLLEEALGRSETGGFLERVRERPTGEDVCLTWSDWLVSGPEFEQTIVLGAASRAVVALDALLEG